MNARIAFIGAGNMARSLIGGLLRKGHDASALVAADPLPDQRASIAGLGVSTTPDNTEAVRASDVIVLAVKPQVVRQVLDPLRLGHDQLLVSVAAGVPIAALARWCRSPVAIVRCMPNTPALYGAGVTVMTANDRATAQHRELATAVLSAAGTVLWVENEDALDAVTAVSGSGPAYFFYLMEAMIEAGQALGLDAELATQLTLETARGAALMAAESSESPALLRARVTSPGGTTERALRELDAGGVRTTLERAIHAAAARSREIGAETSTREGRA